MPYPFAHPAAVLPLIRPMGRFGVPAALVIGSMVPDAWYLVPGLVRSDSHSFAGLFWFCLPLGFAFYLLWNGARPRAPFPAVACSLLVGALTHFAWDAVAHSVSWRDINVLQHASTVLGTAFIVWWCHGSVRLAALAAAAVVALGAMLHAVTPDVNALRSTLVVPSALALALLLYWRLRSAPATAPRAPRAPSPHTPAR
ncbi:MAG: DUF4184 family protein [Betaproteobacteria bacterium]